MCCSGKKLHSKCEGMLKSTVVLAKKTDLEGDLVEVAIKCSQHSLMSNNAHTLAFPLYLNDDWLQPLNHIKVALSTWVPGPL